MPEDAHNSGSLVSSVQDTICSRHDLFTTRSVKTHFTMHVCVSHPMLISPVIECVPPAPAVTLAALSPAIEYVAPTPVVTYTAPSSVIEYVAPAPVVFYAAPATVIECSALWKIGQEHEHSYIWKRRKKRSDDVMGTFFFPV